MIYDSPAQADVALIIDFSNLVYRAYYANSELKTNNGRPSGHIYGSINMLQSIFRILGDSICPIFCIDGQGAKEERQTILPEYKGNREKRDFDPVPEVKEMCRYLPGLHIEQNLREGDDAIAYACKLCASKNIIIYTGDRDLVALVSDKIKVYNPNKNRFVEQADWFSEYHVLDPGKIYLAKSLFGDSSDNIKGVERLIKRQVEPILNDPKCVDIDSFYGILSEKPVSMTENMYGKTKEAESRVRINYQVILPNITGFNKHSVRRVFKTQENKEKLLAFLKQFECHAVLEKARAIYD